MLGRRKILVQRAPSVFWKKWAAMHEYEELKEGAWLEPGLARWLDAKETVRYCLVGHQSMSSLQKRGRERKSTGKTTAKNGTKSDERFKKLEQKRKNLKGGVEVAKR